MQIEACLISGLKGSQHLLRGFVEQERVYIQAVNEPHLLGRSVKGKQEMPYVSKAIGREARRKSNIIRGIGAGVRFWLPCDLQCSVFSDQVLSLAIDKLQRSLILLVELNHTHTDALLSIILNQPGFIVASLRRSLQARCGNRHLIPGRSSILKTQSTDSRFLSCQSWG